MRDDRWIALVLGTLLLVDPSHAAAFLNFRSSQTAPTHHTELLNGQALSCRLWAARHSTPIWEAGTVYRAIADTVLHRTKAPETLNLAWPRGTLWVMVMHAWFWALGMASLSPKVPFAISMFMSVLVSLVMTPSICMVGLSSKTNQLRVPILVGHIKAYWLHSVLWLVILKPFLLSLKPNISTGVGQVFPHGFGFLGLNGLTANVTACADQIIGAFTLMGLFWASEKFGVPTSKKYAKKRRRIGWIHIAFWFIANSLLYSLSPSWNHTVPLLTTIIAIPYWSGFYWYLNFKEHAPNLMERPASLPDPAASA